jgi:hypothetical protein
MTKTLTLETNPAILKTPAVSLAGGILLMTPKLGADFWHWRVAITDKNAIVGFPKFGVVGCGFQHEAEDWNTNLPVSCASETIWEHIKKNAGDRRITKALAIRAIDMIRTAALESGAIDEAQIKRMREAGR